MALSNRWNAIQAFNHVSAQFGEMDPVAYAQRFEMVNLAQYSVMSAFYALMSASYMTPVMFSVDNTVLYATSGNAAFTASTRTLVATSINFSLNDVGKLITFRKGGSAWIGFIYAWVNINTVVLYGPQLPVTDQAALDEFMALNTAITGNVLDISNLPIMRAGGPQVKLELESSATTSLNVVSAERFRVFRPRDPSNLNQIVWYFSGNYIYINWGSGLGTTPGTLTLRYPRVPTDVAADTDGIDLPDGSPIQLFMVVLKRMFDNRFIKSKADYTKELAEAVESTMRTFGIVGKTEEIQNKVQTLAA